VPAELCNSAGNLQGGVLAAFADALLGAATSAHLPEDVYPALAEMKISIFRPARRGATLRGDGYVVKPGKRVLFAEAEVTDSDGNLIARASGTEIPAPA
ncbi:MAG: PaaI family thioesterase, partial [Actinomycetota bacterium]